MLVELAALPGPAVVPLRTDQQGERRFYVVVREHAGVVTLINAGPLLTEDVPEDEFRRRWTGHAIVPEPRRAPHRGTVVASVLAGVVLAVVARAALTRFGKPLR